MTETLFPLDDNDVNFLRVQWNDLLSFYTSDKSLTDHTFQILKERYSERGRFYHNLSHVKFLLDLFESLKDQIRDGHAVRFSIWFHDAVYDAKKTDNEDESARLASETLGKLKVNAETIETVGNWILATKSHDGQSLSEDARLFLDMDLAILGTSNETYEKYSKAIREEYSWVPEPAYHRGRIKILKSFMGRENIFSTDVLQKRFEKQAKSNINREIQALETS